MAYYFVCVCPCCPFLYALIIRIPGIGGKTIAALEQCFLYPRQATWGAGEQLKHAAEDLKAFYNEAATSQPGHSTAHELESWYWQESVPGKVTME